MSGWGSFFVLEIPPGCVLREVSLPRAHRGALRIAATTRILGSRNAALALAKSMGEYRLDDILVHKLRLEGLEIPESGEIPVLSPARWIAAEENVRPLSTVALEWEAEGAELAGVQVGRTERDEFLGFVRMSRSPELGPWEMAEAFEHFSFPYRNSMNLLASTRRRV